MPGRRRGAERMGGESLEPRFAPAGLVTFTDIDGDVVTVRSSRGTNAELKTALVLSAGTSGQLLRVNLVANPVFAGTDLSFTVRRSGDGDGSAAVGMIDAANLDIGRVSIRGDLGRIRAGDVDPETPGIASLSVASIGRYGTATGAIDLASVIRGDIAALRVAGDVQKAHVVILGGDVGTISIGGSVIGGGTADQGHLAIGGRVGALTVRGSLMGGAGSRSGGIVCQGDLGTAIIGGSLRGGAGDDSGSVRAVGSIGTVHVARDLVGGDGARSASISGQSVGRASIGGDLLGGMGSQTGTLFAFGQMTSVTIGGDVRGGAGINSGFVGATSGLGSVSLGGSLFGGTAQQTGTVASITGIGGVVVKGAVVGGSGAESGAVIAGLGGSGDLKAVSVGVGLVGGTGPKSGYLAAEKGTLGRVSVRAGVVGGSGDNGSGSILADTLGVVGVGGDVLGGNGIGSGFIGGFSRAGRIQIGGSLVGGSGKSSGVVLGLNALDQVAIGKHLVGGAGIATGVVVSPAGSLGRVTIGGSLSGGAGAGSGMVGAGRDLVALAVRGGIVGSPERPVQIFAAGVGGVGLRRIDVGGSVADTLFLAGWAGDETDGFCNPVNGGGSIERIAIRGSFERSSIVAGVQPAVFPAFGTQLDTGIPGSDACFIGSVTIGGTVIGGSEPLQFAAIESRRIRSVTVRGRSIPIPAPNTSVPLGITPGAVIRVVSV